MGLLADAAGFPLAVQAFEGNKAETATMLPVINAFKAAYQLQEVTVVADAAMVSQANQTAIEAAGLKFILGTRLTHVPQVIAEWRDKHPGQEIPDGQVFTQPWPATSAEKARGIPDRVIYYQYRHDRARRTLRGIDEQVAKAEKAVAGTAPVKRNRFIKLSGATKTVNRELEAKARALAGIKGYTPTSSIKARSSSSTPTTSCGASRRASACPNTTYRPARSITTNANPSRRTSRSCSPPWRSATGSNAKPV